MKTICSLLFYFIFLANSSFLYSQTVTFNFTGGQQQWIVPAGVFSVNFTVAGAKGGGFNGGNGAIITKTCYSVTPGQTLYIYVGGMGIQGGTSGGWNGGGTGHNSTGSSTYRSWGGGGGTDIRSGGTALLNRFIVAGGGGGRSGGSSPVCGGAANCNNGAQGCSIYGIGGGGGTQGSGGNGGTPWAGTPPGGQAGFLGQGGQGGYWQTASGGGGGGGYYGGGGGGNDGCCTGGNGGGGGGGGSSLVPVGGTCAPGGNSNNGYVTITVSNIAGSTATNTGPYCPGQTIQLNSSGGGTYSWTGPNNFSSSLQNPTIPNLSLSNVGTYTVTVNNGGCTATVSTTVSINISQPIAGNLTICQGSTTQLSNPVQPSGSPWMSSNTAVATISPSGLVTGLSAGTTTITYSSSNGCQATALVTVSGPPVLTVTPNNIACFGGSGSVTLSASGGTAPFTYGATPTTNLAPGSYTYVATSATGCVSLPVTINIIQPQVGLTVTTTQTNVLCFGNSTGAINATPSGGSAPYTYSWSNGATTQNLTAIPSGSYTVTVTDANGCTATATAVITQPAAALAATTTQVMIACFGGNTGSVNMTPTGGTAPYTYVWTGGSTAQSAIGVPAGTYTVTVTDANGCTTTVTATITQPQAPLTLTNTQTNVSCFGNSTGAINLTPAGGTPAYSYLWSNNATTQNLTSLPAGTYSVVVTDANGCTANASVTIIQPQTGLTVTTTQTNVLCFGNSTGAINATPSGGSAPYTYSWSNGATTQNLTAIPSGSYTVTVTDANGCTATATAVITQPAAALAATTTQVMIACFGGNTGSVNMTPTGGTAPYTYVWTGGSTAQSAIGVPAGTYTVTVTDANSCTTTVTATITQPQAPLTLTNTQTNILCFGNSTGAINLTPAGGTPAYSYLWSNNATTQNLTSLPAGTYTVVVTDANGCTANASVTITQPQVGLTVTTTQTNVLCFGNSTGAINATPSGGSAPYTYSWSNGATTQNLTAIPSGSYTVTVTDANGCTATATAVITQPAAALAATTTQVMIACFGGNTGSVNMTPTGGTAPYTYVWTGGSTAQSAIGVPAGTYTVTVTDANGCTTTVTATITQPQAPLTLTNTQTNILCFGTSTGSINLTPAGGTPAYSYLWSNNATTQNLTNLAAGTYSVVVTDANGCIANASVTITQPQIGLTVGTTQTNVLCFGNSTGAINATPSGGSAPYTYSWSNNATTQNLTAIPSGSYTVTVLDANGCTATATAVITQPAAALSATTTQVNILCLNGVGSVNLTVSGGTLGYTYLWSNQVTTEDLANLQAAVYTVVVTDANGCTTTASANILQTLSQVPVAINNLSGTTILTCANPVINLQATGGVTYTWTGGSSVSTAANSFTLPGQYTVNMIDPNGCPVSQNITLTQNVVLPPVQITNNSGATVIDCNNATINLSASGGGQYAWNNGLGSNVNVSIATAGTYTVVVTAANGCVDSSTVIVTVAPTPLITISDTAICSGQSVTLSPTYFPGGVGGTIIWSTSQSTPTITVSPTTTTTYNILYNYNGCPATEDVVVSVNQTPVVTVNNTTICLGDNAQLTATPNAPGGSYLWTQGGETTSSISTSPASSTNYNVVYTLAGCPSAPATGAVTVNPIPTVSVNSITICQGDVDSLTATPNIPGGTYLWAQGGQTNSTIAVNPQSNSNYSVVYTLNGCVSTSAQGTVAVNPLPAAIFIADTLSGCAPLSVQFNADTTNQLATYQWSSSNGGSGLGDQASLTFSNTGCYDITLTATMNGCVNSTTSNGYICVQENPTANFSSSINDFTQPNESVTFINTSIGASGYIWSFGDGSLGNVTNPIHLYSGTNNGFTVTLIAITSMGCMDSTSMTIGYEETASFYIPNTFTPDGDKFNQTFKPIFSSGIDYQNYTMLIYNRWGEIVFETHDVAIGWDGSYGTEGLNAQPGVYTYQITVKIPETDERKIIAGHVNLLR